MGHPINAGKFFGIVLVVAGLVLPRYVSMQKTPLKENEELMFNNN